MVFGIPDEYTRKQLLGVTNYWMLSETPKTLANIAIEIIAALDKGLIEIEGKDGPFAVNAFSAKGGLLSPPNARPMKPDKIALAFRLWLERSEPFSALTLKHGHGLVFSLVGHIADDATTASLIRLNALLADSLSAVARIHEPLAKRQFGVMKNLDKGRSKAIKENIKKGEHTRAEIRALALDYWQRNPAAQSKEVAFHLEGKGLGTFGTIYKQLPQIKRERRSVLARELRP